MGKLQFIQDTVSKLDKLYRLADNQFESEEQGALKPKPKSKSKSDDIPPVIPLTQSEELEDGTIVNKKVKPLTYSLMSWVKRYMNLPDTINIAEDENSAQFEISIPSPDEDFSYSCFFETDEENGLIKFYIYYFEDQIPKNKENKVKNLILDQNLQCLTGQFQIVDSESGKFIRYYTGISVKDIASEDPNYSGEFQISPRLFKNIFDDGSIYMNIFIGEFKELLNKN